MINGKKVNYKKFDFLFIYDKMVSTWPRKRKKMNKIQLGSRIAGLGVATVLNYNEGKLEEIDAISSVVSEETFEEKESYSLEEIDLVSVSDAMGNMEYYFVEENKENSEYQAISNIEIFYASTIPDLRETDSYWVPDATKAVSLINAKDFLISHGFDTTKTYTKEELISLQDTFNSFLFDPYLWVEDEVFYLENLFMIGTEDCITMYDRNFYLSLIENVDGEDRTVVYYYDLTNFKKALKCHYGITLMQEKALRENNDYSYLDGFIMEKETSLYLGTEENNNFYIYDLSYFLTESQIERGYLYKFEVEEIIETLNPKETQIILALKDKKTMI